MTLLDPQWLLGLLAAPVLAVVLGLAYAARRAAIRRFFGAAADRPWAAPASPWVAAMRGAVLLTAISLISVALARPAYDPQPRKISRAGRDVVFVIDVSRSMLAEDIRPNRLERAKLAVRDVLDVVEGDRVGIIAFAGTAVLKCPLTTDYAFAGLALDELGPDAVARGGTAIGSAIRAATELLVPPSRTQGSSAADASRFRDVFVFTDGEDHETDPEAAAREAGEKGIRLITVGLGSEMVGAPVPAVDGERRVGYIEYQGQRVQSKLNPDSLRRIAEAGAPGGLFINVGTGNVELDRVYRKLMRDAERRKLDDTTAVKYTELFQVLLAAAIALLCVEPLIGLRRRMP
jgi:Ca-activated chloride channel family protein